MSRLPTVGSDDNQWGDVLNDFLGVEHNADGTQKTVSIAKGGTGATTASAALSNLGGIGVPAGDTFALSSKGRFAQGYAASGSSLSATSTGAFASGYAKNSGTIQASSFASFARGMTNGGTIRAYGPGSAAWGYVDSTGVIKAASIGSPVPTFAFGMARQGGVLGAYGRGALVHGDAYMGLTLKATAPGAFAGGAHTYGAGGAQIIASGTGSIAHGTTWYDGIIAAAGDGSLAGGYAYSSAQINSNSTGSIAWGYARGTIQALGTGSLAVGVAKVNLSLGATGNGAQAFGYAHAYNVTASGEGAFAQGTAKSGTGAIVASADNAVQFGVGTNSLANSLQVGNAGIRFKGTTGAPGTPANGDIWIASGFLYAHTNGVTGKIQVA